MYVRFIFYTLFLFAFCLNINAQITNEGEPKSWAIANPNIITAITLPAFDLKALKTEDELNGRRENIPYRFGNKFDVDYSLQNSGNWQFLDNGDRIWKIRFSSHGAESMNFILEDFFVPSGATIYLYNQDHSDLLGAYTFTQNNKARILGTWLVKGDDVTLEYFEPASQAGKGSFKIKSITHGYRSGVNLNASNNCNIDVNCSIGNDADPLKDILKKSVALVLVNGNAMCSGALINNTENNGKPYFLTANHCYSDPETWAFRFNWISTNTVCATTEDSVSNEDYHTISGATLRARRSTTDFCLVEINSEIPQEWETVWSGWDRTTNVPPWVFGIHHPAGDIMKTCRDSNPALLYSEWNVVDWEMGNTEAGSSGSPLYNSNGRIIGQLWNGYGICDGNTYQGGQNRYGRFDISWDGGGSASTQLKDWLDPINSGATVLDTYPISGMATSENLLPSKIKVYPNPSEGLFIIDVNDSNVNIDFELVSIEGTLILNGKFRNKINKLNLSVQPSGVYLLKTKNAHAKAQTFKLIKR